MPLEIRELVIRVTIDENPPRAEDRENNLEQVKRKIIEECIEEVLQKLENRYER